MSCDGCAIRVEDGFPHEKWCVYENLKEAKEHIKALLEIMSSKLFREEYPDEFREAELFLERSCYSR